MPSDDRWLTVAQTAELLDMSPQGVRSGFVRLLGDEDIQRTPGEPLRIRLASVLDVLIDRRLRTRRRLGEDLSPDPLLNGSSSPGLERYRMARAALAELELAERQKTVVRIAELFPVLDEWAAHLRRAGDRLQRHHGRDAYQVLADGLDDCELVVQKLKEQTHAAE